MSDKDRAKWNKKYHEKPALLEVRPPSPLIERYYQMAPGKRAIDLACGGGRHTLFLAEHGFHVDAVDISSVALAELGKKSADLSVTLIEEDLETFMPPNAHYDLAVMANYLDRALIERTANALKHDGLFVVETYMDHPENEKKDSNPDFLLAKGELKELFANGFEVLAYEEFWNESYELYRMKKQGIVAKKR
jgi:SAM-dependent methyltransferase